MTFQSAVGWPWRFLVVAGNLHQGNCLLWKSWDELQIEGLVAIRAICCFYAAELCSQHERSEKNCQRTWSCIHRQHGRTYTFTSSPDGAHTPATIVAPHNPAKIHLDRHARAVNAYLSFRRLSEMSVSKTLEQSTASPEFAAFLRGMKTPSRCKITFTHPHCLVLSTSCCNTARVYQGSRDPLSKLY